MIRSISLNWRCLIVFLYMTAIILSIETVFSSIRQMGRAARENAPSTVAGAVMAGACGVEPECAAYTVSVRLNAWREVFAASAYLQGRQ